MTSLERKLARLAHDNEQGQAACREWIEQASDEDIFVIWTQCQKKYDEPAMEIISRLAQLKLAEMIESKVKELLGRGDGTTK